MSKAELENGIRVEAIDTLTKAVAEHYGIEVEEICILSASEFAIPVLDADRNESWVKVSVTVPRGTRNGNGGYTPYNPYDIAKDYAQELADRQAKQDAREAKKKAEAEARAAKKAAKQTIKELNKKGLKAMIHEGE